jgi:hypothetical protein
MTGFMFSLDLSGIGIFRLRAISLPYLSCLEAFATFVNHLLVQL